MKNNLRIFLTAGLLGLFSLSCDDKLTEGLDIVVNADVIRYSVLLQVNEANGETPSNLNISVTGEDADYIYDIAGNKDLVINNGIITVGVHPRHEPTATDPINFSVKLSGPDYLSTTIPVTIDKDQFNQVKSAKVLKLSAAPTTVVVATETVVLAADGTSSEPIVMTTPTTAATPVETKIEVPANTQFLNAAGTPIVGGSLTLNVVNYNTQSSTTASLFPGGKMNATDVTGPDNTKISAFFVPAGFASINLQVGGTAVKKFSQPINLSIELNPEFKLLNSTTPVVSGDRIGIWSYSEDTGKWNYEKEGTISVVNGKPLVSFTTDHLTVYSAAQHVVTTNCKGPSLAFSASWLNTDTQPVTVEVWNDELTQLYYTKTVIVKHGLEDALKDLPTFAVRYKVLNSKDVEIASGRITNPCAGGKVDVALPAPAAAVVGITLSVTVKCPNKGTVTPPDFYLYFKPKGAPKSSYKLLGIVSKGKISTTLLEIGSRYDFKAQWGSKEKEMFDHLIDKKDMSTTVGIDDNLGRNAPEQNKAILIEECSKL